MESKVKSNIYSDGITIQNTEVWKHKNYILLYLILFFLTQIPLAGLKPPVEREPWLIEGAYNLNWELNGKMAKDIPWSSTWYAGIDRSYFFMNHIFFKIFGVGLLQARMVTLIFSILFLLLVFRWTAQNISPNIAILSVVLLTVSFSFWPFLPFASQDIIHCLFGFVSFCLLYSAVSYKRDIYYLAAGFFSALSVSISYRGIIIVVCVYLVHIIYFDKEKFIKRSALLLAGSFVAFIIWTSLNILPMGLSNFLQYNLLPAIPTTYQPGDSGNVIASEFIRFALFLGTQRKLALIEIVYWIAFIVYFFRYLLYVKYKGQSKFILCWLLVLFFTMSFIEYYHSPSYVLMYSPLICILSGISFYELFNQRKKLAYTFLFLILFSGLGYQVSRIAVYYYHQYIKTGYGMEGYFEKLRYKVDLSKNIYGDVIYWYAFTDAQYYGGFRYLGRVINVLHELKKPGEYVNEKEKAKAILNFFKKRKIEYIIVNNLQSGLKVAHYFPDKVLPQLNFEPINEIKNNFLSCGSDPQGSHCIIKTYKIISYDL
tara:strand:+ start:7955 stop:9577 length:1623 start_codon:yes stop_codon:yes gene_type:complete